MNTVALLELIRVADSLLALISTAGVSLTKFQAMREQNTDGRLSASQLEELAGEARRSVDALGGSQ